MLFSVAAFAGEVGDLERLMGKSADGSPAAVVKRIDNDDALRLTSNKDQIIRLQKDAVSVIVNNPDHASVMLDSPRVLIVMPRLPGATSFKVLDARGDIILEKDIIVTNAQRQYVRVRRICAGNDSSCVPAAYYYCPDGCYEVTPVAPGGTVDVPAPAAAAGAVANMTPAPSPTDPAPPVLPDGTKENTAPENSNDDGTEEQPVGPDGEPAPQ